MARRCLIPTALVATSLIVSGCSKPVPVGNGTPPQPQSPPGFRGETKEDLDPKHKAAIAEIEKRGGKVQVVSAPTWPELLVSFPQTKVTDQDLELLEGLKVQSLNLNLQGNVTDKGLEH